MAILEVGINLGMKNLVDIKYYSSSDKILDPNIRARFLAGIKNFITEVFGDKIKVISLSSFEIVCNYKMVQLSGKITKKYQPLLSFLKLYSINDIFLREKNILLPDKDSPC